jgi:hypothetical protein
MSDELIFAQKVKLIFKYLHAAVDDSQADSHEGRAPVQHRRGAHLKVGHENQADYGSERQPSGDLVGQQHLRARDFGLHFAHMPH